jgi:hypothetical protein
MRKVKVYVNDDFSGTLIEAEKRTINEKNAKQDLFAF